MSIHTEESFETAIESYLLNNGYTQGKNRDFDRADGIDKKMLFKFIKDTQPDKWDKLCQIRQEQVEKRFVERLSKAIKTRGKLDVIRNGVTDMGVEFKLAYFKPESSLNAKHMELYKKNILSINRQVRYSMKNENSIDMVLFLNGLPIITIELKNQFTGQDVENAKSQYMNDRKPTDELLKFNRGALVHFAVDTDSIYMTTRLKGEDTYYLPFNKGYNNGAGNPPNPNGYKTAYLWEEVLQKDSLLDIIKKFLQLETKKIESNGKKVKKEKLIFPRYHQLDVVRSIIDDVENKGVGQDYLVQHSTGSGKSNSIAWLSYRLFSLHNEANESMFNSVIVITDRNVLDEQLQDLIFQYEKTNGLVKKIDENSTQLAQAVEDGDSIIITTIQKFPFMIEQIGQLPDRNYAIVIDEAHSSQGGKYTQKVKEGLGSGDDEIQSDLEALGEVMQSRGKQKNLSFFAFTATPKPKTLGMFGTKGSDGKPRPFHLYSMKQAIEEGFILDVLQNYTTYKTFYKLSKKIEEDPNIDKSKASKAIGRFMSLHPHNLSQKTEIIVEHFRQVVSKKIGGKAKAMLVTSSRKHVVRYQKHFDKYIKEKGYQDVKTLVAFSGSLKDDGLDYTEAGMNGFKESELPKKFNSPEYNLLIVANKYQTGFDQPLLHTMYVDKKLSGIAAVQTLSRLNRTCTGKEDTFVLDFVNDRESIFKSFQDYYETTTIEEEPDPNHLYDLKYQIEQYQIIWDEDIQGFAKVYFKSKTLLSNADHGKLNSLIDPAVKRYKEQLTEDQQEEFKHTIQSFTKTYSYLSQIMPFRDEKLEKFFTYVRFLAKKLPRKGVSEQYKLDDDIILEYYRLEKIKEGAINLEEGKEGKIKGLTGEGGMSKKEKEKEKLSEIIKVWNEKFGTEFSEADKLFVEQITTSLIENEEMQNRAKNNSIENFKYKFEEMAMREIIERMDQNEDIFDKLTENDDFKRTFIGVLLKDVYDRINRKKKNK